MKYYYYNVNNWEEVDREYLSEHMGGYNVYVIEHALELTTSDFNSNIPYLQFKFEEIYYLIARDNYVLKLSYNDVCRQQDKF